MSATIQASAPPRLKEVSERTLLAGLALVLRVDGRPLAFVFCATKRS